MKISLLPLREDVIAIKLVKPSADPIYTTAIAPVPSHFHGVLKEGYLDELRGRHEPTTGPYVLDGEATVGGEKVTLVRQEDWWAKRRATGDSSS